jgi:hypothetical protein
MLVRIHPTAKYLAGRACGMSGTAPTAPAVRTQGLVSTLSGSLLERLPSLWTASCAASCSWRGEMSRNVEVKEGMDCPTRLLSACMQTAVGAPD